MIKAETIIHEGNPGPNWLDHCKTAVTTWTATIAIFTAALILTIAVVAHDRDAGQASQTPVSQQQKTSSLSVSPLQSADAVQPSPTNVQAAPGATTSTSPTTTATTLGPKDTPNLNNASTPGQTTNPATTDPTQVTAKTLTKSSQSTIPAVQQVQDQLNKTLKGLNLNLHL